MDLLARGLSMVLLVAIPQVAAAKRSDIGMGKARAIALKAAPGRIEKAERERENGTERYSFDIRQGNRIHEIGIAVATGKVVEDKFESPEARD